MAFSEFWMIITSSSVSFGGVDLAIPLFAKAPGWIVGKTHPIVDLLPSYHGNYSGLVDNLRTHFAYYGALFFLPESHSSIGDYGRISFLWM